MRETSFISKPAVAHTVQENTLTCDNCNLSKSDFGTQLIGGNHFGGWYSVNRTPRGTWLAELQKPRSFDFCSLKCLQEWAARQEND